MLGRIGKRGGHLILQSGEPIPFLIIGGGGVTRKDYGPTALPNRLNRVLRDRTIAACI